MNLCSVVGNAAIKLGCYPLLRWTWDTIYPLTPTRYFRLRRLRKLYNIIITSGDLVFDIGANTGEYTALMRSMRARVIAVEPNRQLAYRLQRRFYGDKDVVIVEAAVGEREDVAALYQAQDHGLSSLNREYIDAERQTIFPSYEWDRKVLVFTLTLNSLIRKYGIPAFIKMDIEGYEHIALRGLSSPVNCISVEYERYYPKGYTQSVERLVSLGMSEFNYTRYDRHQLVLPGWVTLMELIYAIWEETDPNLWGDIYAR